MDENNLNVIARLQRKAFSMSKFKFKNLLTLQIHRRMSHPFRMKDKLPSPEFWKMWSKLITF